ncbi:MAG TPA: hypothetical protein VIL15_00995 [Coriobacteriia bacterium]|jgi:hypothetical protein
MDLGGSSALNWAASQFVFDPLRPSLSPWEATYENSAEWDEGPTVAGLDPVPVFSIEDVIEALEGDEEDPELSLVDE